MRSAMQRVDLRRSRPAQRSGFSLIELLVSIGVLAVLVGLVLPSLHTVMRTTRPLLECTNNLHQIHQALTLYLQDSNDFLPLAGYDPMRDRSHPDLNKTLSKYGAGSMSVWICPADPRPTILKQNFGSEVYPIARLQRLNRVRVRGFDLGTKYPMIADRGAFHKPARPKGLVSPMNNAPDERLPRYSGTINQEGFKDGHNALLAQGTITHRAILESDTEKPGHRSWWRRIFGR